MQKKSFFKSVCALAIPVALQSMLQASFSIVDQIMIGQLGSAEVAGVGLAGKFSSIYTVVVAAIGAVAGIMISQYMGQKNQGEIRRSIRINLMGAIALATVFLAVCVFFSQETMHIYSKDAGTVAVAAEYLQILSGTFLPIAGATILATIFRCMEKATLPLYASIIAACLNTGLNYILIFGKCGFEPMGTKGAAIATLISQMANLLLMCAFFLKYRKAFYTDGEKDLPLGRFQWKQYAAMLMPILVCELMWSLGENVYAGIYGNLGTESCAAMTLINPIQGLMIGALCGLSQAAGVIIGKRLGSEEYEEAYQESKKLVWYGLIGSVILSVVILITKSFYVDIYQVEESVKRLTEQILIAYALIAPCKVINMILSGGIIRSGGRTKYVMIIDIIGTWGFGVPLGMITAFVLHLPIPYVYFILSLEEAVRVAMGLFVFRRRNWMQSLKG